ncbi:TonB-dependent receptor [Roseateles koreensis]|uniref:TonB-dependent receptor n=1 Tax=Roseateles koreensis TaxID=2987526 RepID=A0ABT5KPW1_9BURK|nr:TonB-dependent receptor [Roseateles koreensis]MDC8784891.1 TonB-dependent receptor [Roseateles koreensis]
MKTNRLCTALALIYAGGLGLAGLAQAQQQEVLERVTVTGSSIKRLESETALPVTVITRAQIEQTGATSVEDLLRRVSANSGAFSDSTQGSGYATSNANLRGLGANSTLVLLNGRRLANHPFGSIGGNVSVDLNSIPFAAIERVEVLRDGASAVYGTDAVGGVINFITRKDYKHGELSVRYGTTQPRIGGAEEGGTLSVGFGDYNADRFNLLMTANLQKNTRLRAIDQQLYNRFGDIPDAGAPTSGRAFPGRLVDLNITPGAFSTLNPGADFSACDPSVTVLQTLSGTTPNGTKKMRCRFIYPASLDNLPDQEKGDFFGRFSFKLDQDNELFAEASYARAHGIGRIAPVPIDSLAGHFDRTTGEYPSFQLPTSSRYFPKDLLTKLGYTAADWDPSGTGSVEVALRAVPLGNRTNINTNEQERLVLGARGLFSGWDYDTGLTYAKAKGSLEYKNYVNEAKFIAALATGNINPFGPSADMSAWNSARMEGPMRQSSSTTIELDAKASREIFKMDGGMAAVAVGVDFRNEKAEDNPVNADYAAGLHVGGEGTVPATTASRSISAVFSELSLPFAKGWEATLAARFDHYSDFGSTFNPRAALRYQPTKEVMFRGSYGTGFRAPTLWDVHSPASFTNSANPATDKACPAAMLADEDPRCVDNQFNVLNTASATLKAERSKQYTIGMVFEPTKSISATLDYWSIEKTDQISQVSGDAILSDNYLLNLYQSRIHRIQTGANAGIISYIDTPIENLGGMRTSGLDIDIRGRLNFQEYGNLNLGIAGTYVRQWERQVGKDTPYISYVGSAGDGSVVQPVPRWQHTATAEWIRGVWTVGLENVFVKGWNESALLVYNSVGGSTDHDVKNSSRWNLSASYKGFKDTTLRLGMRNVFDQAAPYTAVPSYGSHAAGYAGSFVDARGRFIYGSIGYQFK